jgi:hypothetical protein
MVSRGGGMDFVTGWKTVSVVLTGLFGILGLLTNYKDRKTGKVTRWGYVSLSGIVFSTTMGVAAQLIETSQRQTAQERAAKQTLAVVENTSQSVTQISRLLQSLDRPRISLSLELDCGSERYKRFCQDAKTKALARIGGSQPTSILVVLDVDWTLFPSALLFVHVAFFRSQDKAEEFIQKACMRCSEGDLHIGVFGFRDESKNIDVWYFPDQERLSINIFVKETTPDIKTRELMAIPDFAGSTVVLTEHNTALENLTPRDLRMTTTKGQEIFYSQFNMRATPAGRLFVTTTPNTP